LVLNEKQLNETEELLAAENIAYFPSERGNQFFSVISSAHLLKIWAILFVKQALTFVELKNMLKLESISVARNLKKLEELELIKREKKSNARIRKPIYSLTAEGHDIFLKLNRIDRTLSPTVMMRAFDRIDGVQKTLYLRRGEICPMGQRSENNERNEKGKVIDLISDVPHRSSEDCHRFCFRDYCEH
jgi:DNA-binding MarR family transcriptional regulator